MWKGKRHHLHGKCLLAPQMFSEESGCRALAAEGGGVMTLSQIGFGLALGGMILLAFDEVEIKTLKQRVAALERRTAPLVKLCDGTEDDFYEAFFRLVQEECEK